MRVHFYDDKDESIFVSDYQGQKLKHAISAGAQWVEIDGTMYAVKSIKKVAAEKKVDIEQPQLSSVSALSDEQRQKNIKRIRQMKQEFLSRRKRNGFN